MKKTPQISIIIVARNEAEKIDKCLKSVSWAQEILVFDNNSSDDTIKIARENGAKVIEVTNGTFSERKNFAFSKSGSNWILSLDADERVTPELHKEVIDLVVKDIPEFGAYAVPRKNIILGKEMKHGGQWPDFVVRLFKKDRFIRWEGELHEQPVIDGKLGYLKNPLIHHKHDNLSEMVIKTNEWSVVEAKLMYDANHPDMNLMRFLSAMVREFYLRIIRQRSYMDGSEGLIYSLYQVFSRFLSYAKLWEMQLNYKKK